MEDHNVAWEEIVQIQRLMLELGGLDAKRVSEIISIGRFTDDTLRQGRGEALGVKSCCVFVAVGESRPLLSRTPIESSFVAIAGVFVARRYPCQLGRTMSEEVVTITGLLFLELIRTVTTVILCGPLFFE